MHRIIDLLKKKEPEPDTSGDAMVGKLLTADIFRQNCADLGYDIEIFTNRDGIVYRFSRVPPKDNREEGEGVYF